jgi:RNA polymerase sigma factor for flagellar operon FliA
LRANTRRIFPVISRDLLSIRSDAARAAAQAGGPSMSSARRPSPRPRLRIVREEHQIAPGAPAVNEAAARPLWDRLARDRGDAAARNALIEHFLPLVHAAAARLRGRVGRAVQTEDLVAAGVFGLIGAVESFDPSRGIRFSTFSAIRIRGAILDELRAVDWVPRLLRTRAKRLAVAARELMAELGRPPSEQELAVHMGLSDGEFLRVARAARSAVLRPLQPPSHRSGGLARRATGTDDRAMALPADRGAFDPSRPVQRNTLYELLTRSLSRAERLIVLLYYYEGLSMREIGKALDLSESRVSQMHTGICCRLREIASQSRTDAIAELAAA